MIRYSAVAENRMMFDPDKGPVASGIRTQHQEGLGRCLPGCKGRLRNSGTTLSHPFSSSSCVCVLLSTVTVGTDGGGLIGVGVGSLTAVSVGEVLREKTAQREMEQVNAIGGWLRV